MQALCQITPTGKLTDSYDKMNLKSDWWFVDIKNLEHSEYTRGNQTVYPCLNGCIAVRLLRKLTAEGVLPFCFILDSIETLDGGALLGRRVTIVLISILML